MTHQRLISLVVPAVLAFACGGGTGSGGYDPYNPDPAPELADQPPLITEPRPPDATQQPGGGTSTPGDTPGGGGGICAMLCSRADELSCELDTNGDCVSECNASKNEACANEGLALLDCALRLGVCPADAEANAAQLLAACSTQVAAVQACNQQNDN